MKRIFIFALCALLILTLGVCVFAEGEDVVTDSVPEEGAETPAPEAPAEDKEQSKLDGFIKKLTESTFWATLVTVLGAIVGIIAIMYKYFGNIAKLISSKADAATIKKTINDGNEEIYGIINELTERLDLSAAEAEKAKQKEQNFITAFTLFIMSVNINQNAKNEIMQYLTGLKESSDNVESTVSASVETIRKAEATEVKDPTPALDTILAESKNEMPEMILG